MDDLSIKIGRRLAYLRKAKGVNQTKVARNIGLAPSVVNRWEKGTFCPSAFYLCKLADFYGCTTDEILGRTTT